VRGNVSRWARVCGGVWKRESVNACERGRVGTRAQGRVGA